MARSAFGVRIGGVRRGQRPPGRLVAVVALVLLALPVVAAVTTTDPAGDVLGATLAEAADQPAVDLLSATGNITGGRLDLSLVVNGTLPIGDQAASTNASHRFSYLFVVALGAEPGANVYDHLDAQRDAITATCHFHQGRFDLTCRVTQGDAPVVAQGASGRNVSLSLRFDGQERFELASIAHESLGDLDEEQNRSIIAQDFTENALPYGTDTGPDFGDDGFVDTPSDNESPWWQRAPVIVAAVLAAVAGVVWWRLRRAG